MNKSQMDGYTEVQELKRQISSYKQSLRDLAGVVDSIVASEGYMFLTNREIDAYSRAKQLLHGDEEEQ